MKPRPTKAIALTIALALVVTLGQGQGVVEGSAQAEPPTALTVFAASSLKDGFAKIGSRFEQDHPGVKVSFSFAGTQELRVQVEHGAEADVFAAADTKHTAALEKAGLLGASTLFAQNRLVVIVPRGNPAGLRSFSDLPRSQRLVVGAIEVPIGSYSAAVIARASAALGEKFRADVDAHIVSRELNVKQIVAKVLLGEADAGIVYETDARVVAGKVETVEIPAVWNVTADYPAAVVRQSRRTALAKTFVDFLVGATAQKELQALGFLPPATAPCPVPKPK
jgi:molybdate transport system substrate-binding protein